MLEGWLDYYRASLLHKCAGFRRPGSRRSLPADLGNDADLLRERIDGALGE